MDTREYVEMDNMTKTSCQLLNILWAENRALTLEELTELLNANFSSDWPKQDVFLFLRQLLIGDYAEKRRRGFKTYYAALGCESEI